MVVFVPGSVKVPKLACPVAADGKWVSPGAGQLRRFTDAIRPRARYYSM
jgi:hypothetical protein